jgi:hypothetical protein
MSGTTSIRQSVLRLAAIVAVAGLVAGAESASAGNGGLLWRSFNPQPEPPRVFWNPGSNVSFNPQLDRRRSSRPFNQIADEQLRQFLKLQATDPSNDVGVLNDIYDAYSEVRGAALTEQERQRQK